ncbi:DUF4157 domain-containing protein [Streptomyces roseirectus]|uniref:DUF4157 domain-containing protein n=2 Tax=Streptomyces roseirectus TaxID=2768066 RepID=A0A7H0IS52_9ACTN|nr:DUF4157 domain-containing protein [Streptomyces roseirectus]QNP75618.1 DUF4157 domain-containing protein [Streptomyces roseirectus]
MQRAVGNAAVARMIQRQRDEGGQDERPVQRSSVPDVLRSPGRPLAEPVRADMERRLGADFSEVRVHDGAAAQRSATEVGARAYTSGNHVVIGAGGGDRHTLAHELVHVVQQRSGPVSGTDNGAGLSVSDPSDRFEREAESTARRVMSGSAPAPARPGTVQRAAGTAVQRMVNEEDAAPAQAVDPLTDFAAARYDPGAEQPITPGARADVLRQIAWEDHWAPISAVCAKYHYTIAVRETGEYSIKRIAEGAKPKPHTILEKSIKPGSVKKEYGPGSKRPDQDLGQVLAWLDREDLSGFVGHWGAEGLMGVRIDHPSQEVLDLGIVRTGARGEQYVPMTVLEPGGGQALTALKSLGNWKTYLYTGDYDLHEAYSTMGAMAGGGQIAEASTEKVNLLNRLNAGVAAHSDTPVRREGTAVMGEHGLHMENSAYAMFQHGDQATYRMNQYLEAQAAELKPLVAPLVKAVATESDEPMGWCRWGQWYVTRNKAEHKALREKWGLTPPNTWSDDAVRRTEQGDYRTAKYI